MKQILFVTFLALLLFACEKESTFEKAPTIPPVETMIIDFGKMADATKSASIVKTNWLYSATTVGSWSLILGTTFAVPVAAFRSAVKTVPTVIDNQTWQWQYEVEGFTASMWHVWWGNCNRMR